MSEKMQVGAGFAKSQGQPVIRMDIIGVEGRSLEDIKILGMIPDSVLHLGEADEHGDFNIYVRWMADGSVRADRSSDDSMIVAQGTRVGKVKAFGLLMQSLADFYGTPVYVDCDPGIGGGQSSKLVGRWAPKCPDCGDTVAYVNGPDGEACVNCGRTTELNPTVEVQADQAQATTDGRPVLGTKVVTDRDMREQVTLILGSDVADFDVPWIVDRIQVEFGTVDISTVPAQRFWDIVHVHGSRDLIEGRRAVVRQMVLAYLGAQSLSAEHVNMDAVVRDLTAPGRVLPGELTPGDIADALIMDAFSLPLVEREIWAGTDTLVKPRFRALLGRRKRKASKVNARRVRGGF